MVTSILWLDPYSDASSNFHNELAQSQLLQTFTKSDDCIAYIKAHHDQSIFLIVSGSLAENVVPQINECVNIEQIFVFCASIAAHANWAVDYVDKLMMFDHGDDLLQRLWTEMEQFLNKKAQQCLQKAAVFKERAQQLKQTPCG